MCSQVKLLEKLEEDFAKIENPCDLLTKHHHHIVCLWKYFLNKVNTKAEQLYESFRAENWHRDFVVNCSLSQQWFLELEITLHDTKDLFLLHAGGGRCETSRMTYACLAKVRFF